MARSTRTTAPTIAAPAAMVLALTGCVAGGDASRTPAASTTTTTTTSTTTATSDSGHIHAASAPAQTGTATGTGTRTGWACTATLGNGCGPYDFAGIPNSNGSNTYVSNQAVGPQPGTTHTVYANQPDDWMLVAHAVPHGYRGVQTFPDVQQLFNNWCGGGWSDCVKPGNTPLDQLTNLKVLYSETSPPDAKSINEFAVDVWSDGYGSDIMFWTDTHGRVALKWVGKCNDPAGHPAGSL